MVAVSLHRAHLNRGSALPAALVGVVGVVAFAVAWSMEHASYDVFVGSLIGLGLALMSLVVTATMARRESDQRIARLLVVAPLLKLSMTVVRYAVAFVIYDGSADAATYHLEGISLAPFYRAGILNPDLGRPVVGTGFIRILTGILYAVTGPSLLGAFFVFSFIGYWGLYCFYRAFCLAVPEGDRHRYALLVLLLPSLLFWPSSLGKEAWMSLGLGLAALGSARLLTHRRHAFPVIALGLAASGAVRPHVSAMLALALAVAYLVRRVPDGASITAPLRKLTGIVVLGIIVVVAAGQARTVLGVDTFDRDAVEAALTVTSQRTSRGGSVIENRDTAFHPAEFPAALVGVLFRPFPWEAKNPLSLIASLEGLTVLGLFVAGWRRMVGGLRSILRTPYVVLCCAYTVLFVYGFSSFSNFGILTRQRVQVLPFVLVLVCLPPYRAREQGGWRALLVDHSGRTRAGVGG